MDENWLFYLGNGRGYLHDGGGEADARGAAARGVLAARRQAVDVGQQLRLGHAGVAHQADVDVAADPHAVGASAINTTRSA